jgi:transcription termination factor NusB
MGLVKALMMEEQEEAQKNEWIRDRLEDPDADESSEEWQLLSDSYDKYGSHDPYEEYEDDWIVEGKSPLDLFDENIAASRIILGIATSISSRKSLLVMLHAHVVTAVGAYLSSTFIKKALSTDLFMRKLVETDPEFAKQKFTIQEIFTKRENLRAEISQYLKDLIFHDIAKVKKMYMSVLNIDFGDTVWLFKAVTLRHDCVHRAGYSKDGEEAPLTTTSVAELLDQSTQLVHKINSAVIVLPSDETPPWEM